MANVGLFIIISLALMNSRAFGIQQHMICKSVQDVFSETGASESQIINRRLYQGPPGRIGPPGVPGNRGLQGPPGSPATVYYEKLNNTIEEMISSVFEDLQRRVTELEEIQRELRSNLEKTTAMTHLTSPADGLCSDGNLLLDGRCFLVSLSKSYNLTRSAAASFCSGKGMQLAEIQGQSQQTTLENFLRSKMLLGQTVAEVWIGMQYINSRLSYRSGKTVSSTHLRWYSSSYPSGSSKYIGFDVFKPQGNKDKGIWNTGSLKLQGVMCEREV